MRAVILSILISVVFIFQSSFFTHLQFFGARPDLILGVVISAAITAGPFEGLLVGLLGGIWVDLLRGTFIGLSVPGKMLVGLAVGFIPKRVYADKLMVPVLTAFLATICDQLIFLVLGHSFGLEQPIWASLRQLVISGAIYTALVVPFILKGVKQLYKDFRNRGWYKEQRIL